ncbi:hypothetical protein FOH10_26740 [Nocardia otitidiscaviarum]|uniref:Uncharacterized protein n=1 Tax=Nocardia otitidiscaviarum TaxID=1823 RepID=A0A516NSB9_9NOCA|nr:hypothetical protein [Nocardia otitidiscaviarum]MCP9621029.1 hypothetical protein [Nocardia otitidiscaviarum]QDP81792.1 hypothetical protein FOH10_26740 [Nocardia otitidiscaviarum]
MGETVNPWPGLKQQAGNGLIQVAEGVAQEAAGFAADVANALADMKTYVANLNEHTGFSDNGHLQRALQLAGNFNIEGGRLAEILDIYLDMVNSLGETLVIAGKLYDNAEQDSGDAFNGLKGQSLEDSPNRERPRYIGEDIPHWPGDDQTAATAYDSHFKNLKDRAAAAGGVHAAISPENPYNHLHDGAWFVKVREGISTSAVSCCSGEWGWFADRISGDFENLTGRLARMEQDGSWKGDGANGVINAARLFQAQADDLSADLRVMADNLLYIAGWLRYTRDSMPESWESEWDNNHEDYDSVKLEYAQAFENWYVTGMRNSSAAIPKLTDPTDPTAGLEDPGDRGNNGGDNSGGGNNGGSGNGNGGGSGSGGGNSGGGLSPGFQSQMAALSQQAGRDTGSTTTSADARYQNADRTSPDSRYGRQSTGQQSTGQDGQQALQQLQSAMQQGLQSAQQAAQQALSQAQQSDLADRMANTPLSGLPAALNDIAKKAGGGGPKGGGGAPGGGGPQTSLARDSASSKLFPRAALAAEAVGSFRAGAAPGAGSPMMGPMGPAGAGGAGAQNQGGKERKRPEWLESEEYLEEAIGAPPIVAKPVVED